MQQDNIDQDITEKTIVFGPRSKKSLLRQYPELADEPEFKALASDDLLFAWYIGIPNSPCDENWDEGVRYRSAAKRCFPTNTEKKHDYGEGNFSDEVKVAIEKFKTYSPEARAAAKRMIQTIFNNYQDLVNVNMDGFVTQKEVGSGNAKRIVDEIDWTGRKQYIDSTAKISEVLPSILKQIESGFGVMEKKGDIEIKAIDRYHQDKKDNSL